jgi:hypothetical protein
MVKPVFRALPALALSLATTVQAANSVSLTVSGANTNLNLASRADGYACCNGDSAPNQSPALVTGLDFAGGDILSFSASGVVSYFPTTLSGNNPDGSGAYSMTNYGDGISAPLNVRLNALAGLFLGPDAATGQATPAQLDFGAGLGFASLLPGIGQIFFIGDGLTSDSNAGDFSGQVQQFVVPVGATRLYLGTVDGFGWYNNVGSFDVIVTNVSAIPEPGTYGLMLPGLAVVGWGVRRFRSARA